MLQAAQLIKKERPEIKFFLPVATGIDKKYLEEKINEYGLTVKLCETKTYDLMNCCDFAIATSGTVTLEADIMIQTIANKSLFQYGFINKINLL